MQGQSDDVEGRSSYGAGILARSSPLNMPSDRNLTESPGFASALWSWLQISNQAAHGSTFFLSPVLPFSM